MDSTPEPINWNEVKTLWENQGKEISVIAEGVRDFSGRLTVVESTLGTIAEDVKFLAAAARKNTASIERIEKRLDVFDHSGA